MQQYLSLNLRYYLPILIATASIVNFVACGSDDDGGSEQPPAAEGDWRIGDRIPLPGNITGIVGAPAGTSAFVSLGEGYAIVAIETREPQASILLPFDAQTLDSIDSSGTLLTAHSFGSAGVAEAFTGEAVLMIEGSGVGSTTLANQSLYAPDFNGRGLSITPVDGSPGTFFDPWSNADRVATPNTAASSPSGNVVVFDDPNNSVVHAVDTESNTLMGTYLIGPRSPSIFVPDDDTAVLVIPALREFSRGDPIEPSLVAILDLSAPTSVPELISDESFADVVDSAIDTATGTLYLLSRVILEETLIELPTPGIERTYGFEVAVVDLLTRNVSRHGAVADLEFENEAPFASLWYSERYRALLLGARSTLYFLEENR